MMEERVKAVVAAWREKRGGPWLDTDPIEDFKLLNEIENEGFEEAHDLCACGHSRGDFRDAGYIRGKPETYAGSEKCVGCEREKAAEEAGYNARFDDELMDGIAPRRRATGALARIEARAQAEAYERCLESLREPGNDKSEVIRWIEQDASEARKRGGI